MVFSVTFYMLNLLSVYMSLPVSVFHHVNYNILFTKLYYKTCLALPITGLCYYHNINISSDDYEILLFMLLLLLFLFINCHKIKEILEFQNFKQEFFNIIKCIKRKN